MKKIVSILASLLMILSLVYDGLVHNVKADETTAPMTKIVIDAKGVTAVRGKEIKIPVKIKGNVGSTFGQVDISYDKNVFKYMGREKGQGNNEGELWFEEIGDPSVKQNPLSFLIETRNVKDIVKQDGTLFIMKFLVLENAPSGKSLISINKELAILGCYDSSKPGVGVDVPFKIEDAEINISKLVTSTEIKESEELEYKEERKLDNSLKEGEEKVTQEGVKGVKEITYKITFEDGVQVSKVKISETIKKHPKNKIISYRPKANEKIEEKVETEEIEFKVEKKLDNSLKEGEEKVTQEGVKGVKEITYKITYRNGKQISKEKISETIKKHPKNKIISYRPKANERIEKKVETEEIEFKVEKKLDNSLKEGEEKVTQEGVKGVKEITYKITYRNGKQISKEKVSEKITKQAQNKIVLVGMKKNKPENNGGKIYNNRTSNRSSYTNVPQVNKNINLIRISGKDRYDTSVKMSVEKFNNVETVILASGENYPDALASVMIAKKYNSPILLTKKNETPSVVKNEILRLNAKNLVVIGGENTISDKNLESLGLPFKRVFGSNRYETSLQILKNISKNSYVDKVIVASGKNYADALSLGTYATKNGLPILLVNNNEKKVVQDIISLGTKEVTIVGGDNSISSGFEASIANKKIKVNRIFGVDRFETSLEVAKRIGERDNFVLTDGNNYPDAISSGPLAEKLDAPILLTRKNNIPNSVRKYITTGKFNRGYIIGGESSISSSSLSVLN